MSKNMLIMIMAAIVAVVAVGAVAITMLGGDDDSNEESYSYVVNLEVSEGNGKYTGYSAEGSTVKEILDGILGDEIRWRSNGNVQSYKGIENTSDESWIVFRWQSLNGWVPAEDRDLRDGVTLVLEYAEKTVKNGKTEYAQPAFSVSNEAYFFIQIPNMSELEAIAKDPNSKPDDKSDGKKMTTQERYNTLVGWFEKAGYTVSDIQEGFWIKGTGTNVNEALVDALHTCLFPSAEVEVIEGGGVIEYKFDGEAIHSHLSRSDMFGWFAGFFGWADTQLKNGDWTYWSQFSYNPNAKTLDDTRQWTYNDKTLGKYDMNKYKYFALVLQTTSEKQADDGVEMVMPTPSDIPAELLEG